MNINQSFILRILEQKINNFINRVSSLRIACESLLLLQYNAEFNENKAANSSLKLAYDNLTIAHQNLLGAISQSLTLSNLKEINLLSKLSKIEHNITSAINLIQAISESYIPDKPELVEICKSCLETFSEKEFANIFQNILGNRVMFDRQIILLEDLCAQDY